MPRDFACPLRLYCELGYLCERGERNKFIAQVIRDGKDDKAIAQVVTALSKQYSIFAIGDVASDVIDVAL